MSMSSVLWIISMFAFLVPAFVDNNHSVQKSELLFDSTSCYGSVLAMTGCSQNHQNSRRFRQ